MSESPHQKEFSEQLLQQEEGLNLASNKEHRMKLEQTLVQAERREKIVERIGKWSLLITFALSLVGATKLFGDFDPYHKGATYISIILGVIYAVSAVVATLAIGIYFGRLRPVVKRLREDMLFQLIQDLQKEIHEIRNQYEKR